MRVCQNSNKSGLWRYWASQLLFEFITPTTPTACRSFIKINMSNTYLSIVYCYFSTVSIVIFFVTSPLYVLTLSSTKSALSCLASMLTYCCTV